jgi:hypothetical protein
MRKFLSIAVAGVLLAAAFAFSANATTSPVWFTVSDTQVDATGPVVYLKWAQAPSNVNHSVLYRGSTLWDGAIPNSTTTYTNRDQVVAGTTYTYTLYICSGTANCFTSTASDTVASDTVTVKAGSPACSDLADNDLDGQVDLADTSCGTATWDNESAAPTPTPTPTPTSTPTPPPTQTCDVTACLVAGTYNWGTSYTVPAGKTIQGKDDTGVATVTGEASITNANVTLRDLVLRKTSGSHAVVDVKANGLTLQYLDIDSNLVGGTHGIIVGGTGNSPSGLKVLDSRIHGQRAGAGLTASQVHGIYYSHGSGSGNEIGRDWVYDVSGYGLHFYGSSDLTNVDIHNVVVDGDSGVTVRGGVIFNGPSGNTLHDSVVTDSPSGVFCQSGSNIVTNVRSDAGFSGCTGTGLVTADTPYANEAARDYSNSTSGTFTPGPRF